MEKRKSTLERSPGFWAGMMFAAYGVIVALQLTNAVEGPAATLLYFLPIALLWPLYRSASALHRKTGTSSAAVRRYNQRFLLAALGYMLGLGIAVTLHNKFELSASALFAIAMLPVIPICGMIWAMARYLLEETDEYLRYRAVNASLAGLAVLLGLASFWGFLKTFDVAPHAPGWLAFPIWAGGMGIAQCWMSLRARSDDSAGDDMAGEA
ncbi:hypothetical protein HME9302_02485 [Alteripontixanthobacter maritimus]|uniref:Uncharacterized protein n=1 Tax=Alteripontixanthobacter maritimus TaxID=2161824 RepID=A0A369Q979_9SPHN|nr:hypothetical protein [Alteripontixanthobacter maritimus]RDC61264.1 hypothetical protein HME9302_02485 [Alteripontixanthobacter maritimus]